MDDTQQGNITYIDNDTVCWQWYSFVNEGTGQITFPELPPDAPLEWLKYPERINISFIKSGALYSQTFGKGTHYFTRAGSEDWAQSFAYTIFSNYTYQGYDQVIGINSSPIRKKYVEDQISKISTLNNSNNIVIK